MSTTCHLNVDKLDFEFDLNGYAIVRNFLPEADIDKLNTEIEANQLEAHVPKFHFVETHDRFFDLLCDPIILALCARWIGPQFRFDHAWGVHYPPCFQGTRENLHAGPHQNQGFFHYSWHNNRPRTSCIVFAYAMKDQAASDGGLVLIPGSHKLNYPIDHHASVDIFSRLYGSDFATIPFLARPSLNKGDLLIMAEATVHGTSRWTSRSAWRRNIYYKYCYGFMGWLPHDNDVIQRLRQRARNPIEARLLEPPYVSRQSGNSQIWREPVLGDV
jgi:hypothetical protein